MIEKNGSNTTRESLLDWQDQDRLGVVVTQPFGAIGCSLLMQLAITAFFDAKPERRERPQYPEVIVFHVGGRFGNFSPMDIRPARKEVILDAGDNLLVSLNQHAITHLLVPASLDLHSVHPYKEPEAFIDRTRRCFAYEMCGSTKDHDVSISATDASVLEDVRATLYAEDTVKTTKAALSFVEGRPPEDPSVRAEIVQLFRAQFGSADEAMLDDIIDWVRGLEDRLDEVPNQEKRAIQQCWNAWKEAGEIAQTFKVLAPGEVLEMI